MCSGLLAVAVAGASLMGISNTPSQISGVYYSSCDTSYCKAGHGHCTPQVSAKSVLGHSVGKGYSVKYNYGLEPASAHTWSGGGSSAYNHGGYRLK